MTTHEQLASLWAQYNGQRGTAKQIERIVRYLSVESLRRMLTDRGVAIPVAEAE